MLFRSLTQNKGVSLSIGATKTIGEYVIGDHVSAFLSEPDHRISVTVENTETLLTDLSAGKIDFALIEGYFDRSRYASRLYRKEPFVGLCGKSHPFAGRTITLDELWDQDLILREAGSGTRDGFESITDTEDKCAYRQELTSTGDVITTVASNPNAIGYASLASVKDTVKAVKIDGVTASEETIKNGTYVVQRPFVLVTKTDVTLSESAQSFYNFITSEAAHEIIIEAGVVPAN